VLTACSRASGTSTKLPTAKSAFSIGILRLIDEAVVGEVDGDMVAGVAVLVVEVVEDVVVFVALGLVCIAWSGGVVASVSALSSAS